MGLGVCSDSGAIIARSVCAACSTSSPQLLERQALVADHDVGRGQPQRARRLRGDDGPHLRRRSGRCARPRASTCVCGWQSTTSTRSTCARQRPDSTSSGMSNTMQRAPAASAASTWRAISCAHQRVDDGLELAPGLRVGVGALAHAGAVQRAVGGDERRRRTAARWRGIAAPPAAVVAREMASASITAAPSCAQHLQHRALAAADAAGQADAHGRGSSRRTGTRRRAGSDGRARRPGRAGRRRPGRGRRASDVACRASSPTNIRAMPTTAPIDGRHQDDRHQALPAEPGAQRGQQLEVAVAHAFLAGGQLEQPGRSPRATGSPPPRPTRRRPAARGPAQRGGDAGQPTAAGS